MYISFFKLFLYFVDISIISNIQFNNMKRMSFHILCECKFHQIIIDFDKIL